MLLSLSPMDSRSPRSCTQSGLDLNAIMNPNHLTRLFPNASKTFLRANSDSPVPDSKPQPDQASTLVSPISGEAKSVLRATVCFTLFRVKLLDPDNAAGSVKDLLDGLRHAGLISGDEWHRIKLEVEQIKVSHYSEEKTVIRVTK